ncbi:MAG TPA: galactose oxidase-like domain-containing protein, partial [Gemmatimonadales bacterium]|nr:galactose oxidase-like domain-containing protein [Gemmatimonadales bacterium]
NMTIRQLRSWGTVGVLAILSLQCDGGTDVTAPTDIDMVSGNEQRAVAGQPLSHPLVVEVTDETGDPVAGVDVHWAAQGGGSVSASLSKTGSNGRASVQRVLGPDLGEQTTTATATGLQGSPVTFVATAVPSAEIGSITITTNPPVSALDGEVFDPVVQPAVQVQDVNGVPASGVSVAATIGSGAGTLEGRTTATTDASGTATFADLGIRGTGTHDLVFTAGSVTVTSSPIDVDPLPEAAAMGSWGPVVNWDIVPLHMSLLPSGKIFAWGKTDTIAGSPADTMGMPRIWDPASQAAPSGLPEIHVEDMLFCAGHTLLADGRLMVAGGHHQDDAGIKVTYFFDGNGAPQKGPDMVHGRWYPTLTVLADGRVVSMAGRDERKAVVTTPEIWENNQWVPLPGAGNLEIPYYPRNFVDPKNGMLFYASERVQSRWFNPDASSGAGRGSWIGGPTHVYQFNRDYGSAVMYDTGKILVVGGGGDPNWKSPDPKSSTPTATAETIDLNQTVPAWRSTGSMAFPRRHMNATILPDGQVLATGGTRGGRFVNIDPGLAVQEAEIWNPSTGSWSTLSASDPNIMRIYHSVSLLLPDGTVLHGASGDALIGDGVTPVPSENNHQIFSPPYLFKGTRPSITSAPSTVGYGQTFTVATPNAAQITEARWIRLGSVTHAFDMNARANTLSFVASEGGVEVTAPANPNLAPPGHYMLFILNRNGVPSPGHILRVQ